MKTEQEQIEKMARTMCGYCSTDGRCAVSKNGREPDICANVDTEHCLYKEYAERLIEAGYGDISEYKAEIERLKAKNKSQERENGFLKYCQCLTHGVDGSSHIKKAQIDVLTKLEEKIQNAIDTYWNSNGGGYYLAEDAIDEIDKMIEELTK